MEIDQTIRQTLGQIIHELIPINEIGIDDKLVLIGSESVRMVAFISAIEDEWDIEIDDELINSNFFLNIKMTIAAIEQAIVSKQNS